MRTQNPLQKLVFRNLHPCKIWRNWQSWLCRRSCRIPYLSLWFRPRLVAVWKSLWNLFWSCAEELLPCTTSLQSRCSIYLRIPWNKIILNVYHAKLFFVILFYVNICKNWIYSQISILFRRILPSVPFIVDHFVFVFIEYVMPSGQSTGCRDEPHTDVVLRRQLHLFVSRVPFLEEWRRQLRVKNQLLYQIFVAIVIVFLQLCCSIAAVCWNFKLCSSFKLYIWM